MLLKAYRQFGLTIKENAEAEIAEICFGHKSVEQIYSKAPLLLSSQQKNPLPIMGSGFLKTYRS
mgnify:CR=1 FL=1